MAYRFLLEVPVSLAEEASLAVERVEDAQVVLIRPSHGLSVDDPYQDMTVAAQTLRVVDSIYDWFESKGSPPPLVELVLHGGERYSLADVDRQRMVALIRRDQPWVERSIPHIGDHEPSAEPAGYTVGPGAPEYQLLGRIRSEAAAARAVDQQALASTDGNLPDATAEPALRISAINYIMIQVNDLRRAEEFYQDFLEMTLLGRVRRGEDGTMVPLPSDYSWAQALQTGELADVSFLNNGPLTLAAMRIGIAILAATGPVSTVSLAVDARTFNRLKGEVLMRPLTVVRSGVASFVFRDPFMVNWEITIAGSVPLIPA
jgi:catechol 2,3-dioxygenase-like lactoylglutathione lyase family enzyme